MKNRRWIGAAIALAATAAVAADDGGDGGCLAGKLERSEWAARAVDEATGEDLRGYPPDRIVDFLHMTLEMRFEDLNEKRFTATETLRVAPIGAAAAAITLDAVGLDIGSVTADGRPIEHYHDGERLTLRFDPPLPPGRKSEIVIRYECVDPADGMYFTPSASPGALHDAPQVHTQGETQTNSHWFACHDFPNERLTTELIVDVPSGFAVSGNGRLVTHTDDGTRAVWHYLQDLPHVNYLVALVIGKFDIVEIPHPRVPLRVWVPPGQGDLVLGTFGRTGEMLDVLERSFGHPYPWDRYDQILVRNFGSGGMENTTATTLLRAALRDEAALRDGDSEGLISHELAHQWTGDLFTCRNWSHIWLNEGWASYGSWLWLEHRDGPDGYLDSVRRAYRRLARRDKTTNELPMVSPVYEHAWENFARPANPYAKGASILHMLRSMVGDEIFFECLQAFVSRYAFDTVETDDFRRVVEAQTGLGLEWFFDQWCYRPGVPALEVTTRYDGSTRELQVEVEQTQEISARTPAFRFVLPVWVRTAGGERTFEIDVRRRTASFRAALDGSPVIVAVDPRLAVLAAIDEDKALPLWIAQANGGPTIAARRAAVDALAATDSPETIELVAGFVADETLRHTLRAGAVEALAAYGSKQARSRLLELARAGADDPRVRASLVEAIGKLDRDESDGLLVQYATTDDSDETRVAAIRALAKRKAPEHADLFVELVGYDSHADSVRNAAITALADLDDARGLDLGITYSAYGYEDRSRPVAIAAVGKLAHHDPERAVPYLLALLDDHERRTVRAAGGALAATGDERAVAPIKAISETNRSERLREDAKEWLKKLQGEPAENDDQEE